jgi:hypothetical protein
MDTMIPCLRFDNDANGDSVETPTLVNVESSYTDGMVDVHVAPQMDNAFTFSLNVEDGWRFLRELAAALTEAESEH